MHVRSLFASFILAALLLSRGNANPVLVRETDPLTPEQEQAALKVPDGFEVQLFAAEPMINKPINLAYDDRGRIWVSSTVEYPYAAPKHRWVDEKGSKVRDSRDAIKILEDTDGDGRADKVTDFADGLNIPTGVLPWHKPEHEDGCIAWSIPNIWYFADTTGDGRADHREVLLGPLGYERDTHGMCSSFRLGPDGWVYATHGFNNQSKAVADDGSTVEMHSGNVFRFRPDGSHVEIWSRGQVNPFGLTFDRRGYLYSADCHSAPVYQLLRGAFYPSFGKPHDGIGFGPSMIEHTHGSTGICGISYIDRDVWGEAWNDHLFIGNPVTSRVNHDRIEFAGSTPVAVEQPDFVVSEDPWFRPVDLCLGGDGALYVADFYNKIIGHYEVPLDHPGRDRERGRIWRIVKKDGAKPRSEMTIPEISDDPIADLAASSPHVRRAAATHLQMHPVLEALPALLRLMEDTPPADTHLRHICRMAIREHLRLPGAFAKLDPGELPTEYALWVESPPSADFLLQARKRTDAATPPNHSRLLTHIARFGAPETLAALIAYERGLHSDRSKPLKEAELIEALARGLEERGALKPSPDLIDWGRNVATKILANPGRDSWIILRHPDDPESDAPWNLQRRKCADGQETAVLSSLRYTGPKTEQLTGILRSKAFPAPEQLGFWICGHRGPPEKAAHDKNYVRLVRAETDEELRRVYPPRNDVAEKVVWDLSDLKGKPVQIEIVDGDTAGAFAWLAITRIEPEVVTVSSFDEASSRARALQRLATLLKVTAPADLRDQLRPYLPPSPAPPPVPVTTQERARLDKLIATRAAAFAQARPDRAKGAALFTTHCATCHQISGEGALLGPQLDGIGARGALRLCEDILDPNRNVDAHFYLTSLTMKDGSSMAGFVRAESGAVLLLVDAAGNEHRIQKSSIASQDTTPLSLMPPTFDQVLSENEFHDLLGWLLEQ